MDNLGSKKKAKNRVYDKQIGNMIPEGRIISRNRKELKHKTLSHL
jgi:hypothetical protein